jgi:mandelate racemase
VSDHANSFRARSGIYLLAVTDSQQSHPTDVNNDMTRKAPSNGLSQEGRAADVRNALRTSIQLKEIRVRKLAVPLRRPLILSSGRFDCWPLILIDLETSTGIVGHAYIAPHRIGSVSSIVAAIRHLASVFKGRPIVPFDDFWVAMKALSIDGETAVSTVAVSGFDTAMWDALAKEVGLPLSEFLGGALTPTRAYNSNGLRCRDSSALAAEARMLQAEGGFLAMKLRLGNTDLKEDLAAIHAVREGVGSDIDLMIDFDRSLRHGPAIQRCYELDAEDVYWFKDPITYDSVPSYSRLAKDIRTPLQMGEYFYGSSNRCAALSSGAPHYAMADVMRIGGVTGWLRTAVISNANGVPLSNHLYPEIAVHMMPVTPTSHWIEWVDWANPILSEPLQPRNGFLTAPDCPGLGIGWNEQAVDKYQMST